MATVVIAPSLQATAFSVPTRYSRPHRAYLTMFSEMGSPSLTSTLATVPAMASGSLPTSAAYFSTLSMKPLTSGEAMSVTSPGAVKVARPVSESVA
ncbi:MAG: hypothetical protein BWY37_01162 [Firmicutes bacterium ADurb.Bin262]|nr:MAG: hypothetical protein BWY37_01162 [Firmicutes bacterium ADurb.Bin262]